MLKISKNPNHPSILTEQQLLAHSEIVHSKQK